jgi:hypothetical protein
MRAESPAGMGTVRAADDVDGNIWFIYDGEIEKVTL